MTAEQPWLDAEPGQRWVLTQGDKHETTLWIAQVGGVWRSEDGKWWLLEDEDLAAIHSGTPAGPAECRQAYPGALERGEVVECARTGRHWKHKRADGTLAWWGTKLDADGHAEADRVRALGGLDRAKLREWATELTGDVSFD